MGFSHEIVPQQHIVLGRVSGEPTVQEFVDEIKALVSDPAYDPSMGILADARELNRFPNANVLDFLVTFVVGAGVLKRQPIALVTAKGGHFEHAETAAVKAGAQGFRAAVFTEVEDARVWLRGAVGGLSTVHD